MKKVSFYSQSQLTTTGTTLLIIHFRTSNTSPLPSPTHSRQEHSTSAPFAFQLVRNGLPRRHSRMQQSQGFCSSRVLLHPCRSHWFKRVEICVVYRTNTKSEMLFLSRIMHMALQVCGNMRGRYIASGIEGLLCGNCMRVCVHHPPFIEGNFILNLSDSFFRALTLQSRVCGEGIARLSFSFLSMMSLAETPACASDCIA